MKKTIYSILAVAAGVILACACSKENPGAETVSTGKLTLTAILPGEFTKTVIDAKNNTKVNWAADDSLNVWDEYESYDVFELQSGAGTTSATFAGGMFSTGNYAMYPCFESDATISAGVITTKVRTVQKVPSASFDPKAAIMVGTISGTYITFHHAVAYLKITAPSDVTNLAEITVESNGGVQLTGDARFAAADGAFTATGTAKNYVTVKPASGSFTAGAIYYAAVIPGTYTDGLTIRYLYKDNSAHTLVEKTKINTTTLTLAAGDAKLLGPASTFDHSYEAVQLWAGGPYWAKTNIGAAVETDPGQYFVWGYTQPYSWNDSAWSPSATFDKNGFPDYKTHTFSDMASANLGAGWSVPTDAQFKTLINSDSSGKCSVSFVTTGVKGVRISGTATGYTSNSIFLPACGYGNGQSLNDLDNMGYYWSCVPYSDALAYYLIFILGEEPGNESIEVQRFSNKYNGQSVRPIRY